MSSQKGSMSTTSDQSKSIRESVSQKDSMSSLGYQFREQERVLYPEVKMLLEIKKIRPGFRLSKNRKLKLLKSQNRSIRKNNQIMLSLPVNNLREGKY